MRQLILRVAVSVMALGLTASLALAQQRMVPISPKAKRADITFNGTPDILVDGKTVNWRQACAFMTATT